MKLVVTLLAAISLGGFVSPLIRPSNSQKLAEDGLESWSEEKYAEAARAFEQSREIRTTAESTFDLGTALVGAEDHVRGEQVLRSLSADGRFAAPSWYNAGNSQLFRGALDDAIESYTHALHIEPTNMSAKRNLEIALRRRQERQQAGGQQGEGQNEEPQNQPGGAGQDEQDTDTLDPDLENVLRSIDQQEREELSRMRRANAIRRPTDW